MTINNTAKVLRILTLTAAYLMIGTSGRRLDAAARKVLTPGIDQTVQYILNLVNTESGATRSLQTGETRWTYSMTLLDPCTLTLTERLQRLNSAFPGGPTAPVDE